MYSNNHNINKVVQAILQSIIKTVMEKEEREAGMTFVARWWRWSLVMPRWWLLGALIPCFPSKLLEILRWHVGHCGGVAAVRTLEMEAVKRYCEVLIMARYSPLYICY
jgi:hypothetical protein